MLVQGFHQVALMILAPRRLLLALCMLLSATFARASAETAKASAWFWLSSDQIRALRDVAPAEVLVFNWSRHNEVFPPGPGEQGVVRYPHPDTRGTLVLGADYVVIEQSGGATSIYDFRLDRLFQLETKNPDFENHDLVELMFLRDEETLNRRVQGKLFEVIGSQVANAIQPYYEAELGARTRSLPPISVSLSVVGGQRVAVYNGEAIAGFKDMAAPLTPQQSEMFARALRYFEFIHPAALDAIMPLRTALSQATGIHSDGGEKLRTTVTFDAPVAEQRAYPLSPGLHAKIHADGDSNAAYVNRLTDIGLNAVSGAAGPRPSREDYAAEESRARAAGDLLGTGLASIALTTHYPDEPALCQEANAPPRCQHELSDFEAATSDSSFRRVAEASEVCAQHPDKAAQLLGDVDVSGRKHGYMANYLMYCALRQMSSDSARKLAGRFVPSAADNMIRALSGNPFIPAFYFDAGMQLVGNWDASGWQLIEIGEALGGGTAKGDAYDKDFSRLKRDIMTRYPERF